MSVELDMSQIFESNLTCRPHLLGSTDKLRQRRKPRNALVKNVLIVCFSLPPGNRVFSGFVRHHVVLFPKPFLHYNTESRFVQDTKTGWIILWAPLEIPGTSTRFENGVFFWILHPLVLLRSSMSS